MNHLLVNSIQDLYNSGVCPQLLDSSSIGHYSLRLNDLGSSYLDLMLGFYYYLPYYGLSYH